MANDDDIDRTTVVSKQVAVLNEKFSALKDATNKEVAELRAEVKDIRLILWRFLAGAAAAGGGLGLAASKILGG